MINFSLFLNLFKFYFCHSARLPKLCFLLFQWMQISEKPALICLIHFPKYRNTEFDPRSVKVGTAAANIRCCYPAAVIQQLYFWQWHKAIETCESLSLDKCSAGWLKHWTAEVLTVKRNVCTYGNFMLWNFYRYFLCTICHCQLTKKSSCGTGFLNCNTWLKQMNLWRNTRSLSYTNEVLCTPFSKLCPIFEWLLQF